MSSFQRRLVDSLTTLPNRSWYWFYLEILFVPWTGRWWKIGYHPCIWSGSCKPRACRESWTDLRTSKRASFQYAFLETAETFHVYPRRRTLFIPASIALTGLRSASDSSENVATLAPHTKMLYSSTSSTQQSKHFWPFEVHRKRIFYLSYLINLGLSIVMSTPRPPGVICSSPVTEGLWTFPQPFTTKNSRKGLLHYSE